MREHVQVFMEEHVQTHVYLFVHVLLAASFCHDMKT
jgi:hypothetical protein